MEMLSTMNQMSTRDLLKRAARRLFAARGFDGVAVRDIVDAAGQRNSGSLHYYFGTKEMLARELVADGAVLIDKRRNEKLDQIEAAGGPRNLREIVEVLVWPSTNLDEESGSEDTYIRFISMLQMSHRQLFLDALEGKWALGYQRCLAHIRRLLKKIDPEIVNQRLVFMSLYLRSVMSSREAALEGGRLHHFWSPAFTIENLIDTIEGLLTARESRTTATNVRRHRIGGPQASKAHLSAKDGARDQEFFLP
jgi:AcrR family transcriptional regulator